MDEETLRNLEMRVVELENQVQQFRVNQEVMRNARITERNIASSICWWWPDFCLCRCWVCHECSQGGFCRYCARWPGGGTGGDRFGGLGG